MTWGGWYIWTFRLNTVYVCCCCMRVYQDDRRQSMMWPSQERASVFICVQAERECEVLTKYTWHRQSAQEMNKVFKLLKDAHKGCDHFCWLPSSSFVQLSCEPAASSGTFFILSDCSDYFLCDINCSCFLPWYKSVVVFFNVTVWRAFSHAAFVT